MKTIYEERAELHQHIAQVVDGWIINPTVLRRFRDKVTDFCNRWDEWHEATEAYHRRYEGHCQRILDEPRLRDFEAGPPHEAWVFQDYLPKDHSTSIEAWGPDEGQVVPPRPEPGGSGGLSARPDWEAEPTEADLLPGYYALLAVVHDHVMGNTPRILTREHLQVAPLQLAAWRGSDLTRLEPYNDKDVLSRALKVVEAELEAARTGPRGEDNRKGGWLRYALSLVAFVVLLGGVTYCAWRWEEGQNFWQKIKESLPLLGVAFTVWVILAGFLLGKKRLHFLVFWKGDEK